jgi:hypothetical protein
VDHCRKDQCVQGIQIGNIGSCEGRLPNQRVVRA